MNSFIHLSKHVLVILVLCSGRTECGSEANNLEAGSQHSGATSQNCFFYQQSEYPRDCQEALRGCSSNSSGVYVIKPDGYPNPFDVYCDHDEGSSGWTVIQRRVDGSVDFDRSWEDYKNGFGFLRNNFWLGNEKLSYMTNQAACELWVDMELSNGSSFHVTYSGFRISDEWDNYQILQIQGFKLNGESRCESGWLTYAGSDYCVYQDGLPWSRANSVCSSIGGHLAWVESEAENQFLRNNIGGWTWIGISDGTVEGEWKYVDTEFSSTYFNWGSGEPNSYQGRDEDCVDMYTNGYWNDEDCTLTVPFVCEKE